MKKKKKCLDLDVEKKHYNISIMAVFVVAPSIYADLHLKIRLKNLMTWMWKTPIIILYKQNNNNYSAWLYFFFLLQFMLI